MQAHKTDFKEMISAAHLINLVDTVKTVKIISPEAIRKMVQDNHPAVHGNARSKK